MKKKIYNDSDNFWHRKLTWKSEIGTFGQLISEFWQEIWNWLKVHFLSVAKAGIRIGCGIVEAEIQILKVI